ncbi:MAG: alpha/beta fold hydrolase [Lachnospiraceae bacterium]|nr:alpha/beta fold hydrolase [Lachnospiraceae bacterium]
MAIRTEELRYDSRDRETKIYAKKWIPEGTPRAILQIVHGMSEAIDRYDEYAGWMAERGIMVIGNDHLGHGKTKTEEGTWGYFCKRDPATVLVRDVHRLKKIVQEENPGVPIVLMGHSLGAIIAREYISRYGTGISGAILQATGMQNMGQVRAATAMAKIIGTFCGDKHRSGLINRMAFGHYNDRIPKPCPASAWLSHNEENIKKYEDDPAYGFTFTINGFLTMGELIRRTQDEDDMFNIPKRLPIFIACGTEDPTGGYGKGVKELCDIYRNVCHIEDVTLKLYDGMRHEIHNEIDRVKVYEDELAFIERVIVK